MFQNFVIIAIAGSNCYCLRHVWLFAAYPNRPGHGSAPFTNDVTVGLVLLRPLAVPITVCRHQHYGPQAPSRCMIKNYWWLNLKLHWLVLVKGCEINLPPWLRTTPGTAFPPPRCPTFDMAPHRNLQNLSPLQHDPVSSWYSKAPR